MEDGLRMSTISSYMLFSFTVKIGGVFKNALELDQPFRFVLMPRNTLSTGRRKQELLTFKRKASLRNVSMNC